jgi:hypothetical protein
MIVNALDVCCYVEEGMVRCWSAGLRGTVAWCGSVGSVTWESGWGSCVLGLLSKD